MIEMFSSKEDKERKKENTGFEIIKVMREKNNISPERDLSPTEFSFLTEQKKYSSILTPGRSNIQEFQDMNI